MQQVQIPLLPNATRWSKVLTEVRTRQQATRQWVHENPFNAPFLGLTEIVTLKDNITSELYTILETFQLWSSIPKIKQFRNQVIKNITILVKILSRNAHYFLKNRRPNYNTHPKTFKLMTEHREVLGLMDKEITGQIKILNEHLNQYIVANQPMQHGHEVTKIAEPLVRVVDHLTEYFKLAREFKDHDTGRSLVDFGDHFFRKSL